MIKRLLFILLVSLCVSSCGEALKSSWSNFRAYYNTFYNAKEHFSAGLKKVQEQPVVIDPTVPVRVHPAPVPAGEQEFEQAIEKGTKVMQQYSGTKWIDDALLLTGKALYYRQEFYPALQKFEELSEYSPSPKMQARAVIWKGRTLLDLGLYSEGVEFLETEINARPQADNEFQVAEMQVLMAEHQALMGHWEQSASSLLQAIDHLENNGIKGRAFFLYGQVLERSNRLGEASFAFSNVREHFAGFEYEYWAGYKQADVARKEGNIDLALSIYESLRKDDKNLNRLDQLTFQIARTREMMGETDQALILYDRLLERRSSRNRDLRSVIYYRMGTIYGDIYEKFSLAAAYFDSSAMIRSNSDKGQQTNTRQMAEAYGRYTELQEQVTRVDSLLWLGSLSEAVLDSVLEEVRLQKRRELLDQREEKEEKLANRTLQESNSQRSFSSMYGFLNHQNAQMVEQSQNNFIIVWGNRPLVDNWRRMDVVQQHISSNDAGSDASPETFEESDKSPLSKIAVDTEPIPTTEEQRARLREEQAAFHYELGNLLLFSLNEVEKARYHFHRVLNLPEVQEDMQAKAMYSLHESFKMRDKTAMTREGAQAAENTGGEANGNRLSNGQLTDSLRYWKNKLTEQFPNTDYAQRIRSTRTEASGSDQASGEGPATDSTNIVMQKFNAIVSSNGPFKGAELRSLALTYRHMDMAPYIYFKAVEDYISQAKASIALSSTISIFDSFQPDSLLLTEDTLQVKGGDLIVSQQQLGKPYFQHTQWDSVRVVLEEFEEYFPEAAQSPQVAQFRTVLMK